MKITSALKRTLKKSNLLVEGYRMANIRFRALLYEVSPVCLAKFRYRERYGRWPDLKNPRSFDEKLLWLMLYWRHPLKSRCADKYAVRTYVEEHGLGHLLPKLLGVYDAPDEINFAALPQRFVLKCTHGCGFNIICRDVRSLNPDSARRQLQAWLKINISKLAGEVHYAQIRPRIIAEEFLDDLTGELPCDYKLYCFDGRMFCALACTERESGHPEFHIYDREWATKLPYRKSTLLSDRVIPKPAAYAEMVAAAEVLSKPFPFVRVDFYNINRRPVLGEMTFTPRACINPDYTDLAQRELAAQLKLPQTRLS